jgi:heparinase II/III-like protein
VTLAGNLRKACLAAVAFAVTLGGCVAAAYAPAQRDGSAPSPDARACGSMLSFPAGTADQIMAGKLTIAPFPAATIGKGTVDWSMNPFHDPTWRLDFRWGEWVEALIERYLAGGPHASAYRDRAKVILKSWIADVPIADKNPLTAICSAQAFPGQAWIHNEIPVLLDYYAAHWQGAYNHGLSQDLELLRAGCAYPAAQWGGRPAAWRRTALAQMTASFEPNKYGPAVDAQGVSNEQATGYANFSFGLWTTAEAGLRACGLSLPGWVTGRIAKMPLFLALATQPDGKLVQIGDTYQIAPRNRAHTPLQFAATRGAKGTAPSRRIGVYPAGYVFGRSAWGTANTFGSQSFYSLRFGPGTQIHGHADHMSLTYYARGRNLIVNAGHDGYANTPYRAYLLSPEASSMLVMPGVPFLPSAATRLVSSDIQAKAQFYEFYDTAFGGLPRWRSVYVDQDPGLILVFDRASGAARYEQLWHLDPSLSVRSVTASTAVAAAPGTQLVIKQVPLPGQRITSGSTRVASGFVSRGQNRRTRAKIVTMTRGGASAAMLTLIAPTAPGARVKASIAAAGGGRYRLRVTIGGQSLTFLVTAGGAIK